jgi:hypothetical protein
VEYSVIGAMSKSAYDDTVRVAPLYAYYQAGILDVINKNTVNPNNPKEIFTGGFIFADDNRNSDDGGKFAFPAVIAELFTVTQKEGN